MKDHMKVSLSKVLKPKNSREDSREENLSYQRSMLFKSWLDSVQSIISSPPTGEELRIDKLSHTQDHLPLGSDLSVRRVNKI